MTNRELTIATAPRRTTTTWTNTHTTKQDLTAWAYEPTTIPHTQTEYANLTKDAKAEAKDVGGFIAGHLRNGHRRKGHILNRSLITLDIDYLPPDVNLPEHLQATLPVAWLAHTTLSHTPANPRWRLWVWLTRNINPDEYAAIARRLAQDINPGLAWFDPSTFEPERFMYKPSTTQDGDYHVEVSKGSPELDPDAWLLRYTDWSDVTTWPGITPNNLPKANGDVQDPRTRPGLIGAFNRAYTPITKALDTFLSDVYKPGTVKNRYTYIDGTSSNGLIVYDNGLHVYSQHATDPACETLCNAFDIVRIHKFADLDTDANPGTPTNKLPSYTAMMDFIEQDEATKRENTAGIAATLQDVFDVLPTTNEDKDLDTDTDEDQAPATTNTDWLTELETKRDGTIKDTIVNFHHIFTHDPRFNCIAWNAHANALAVRDPQLLPWKQLTNEFTDNDMALLKQAIADAYGGLYAPTKMTDALIAAATRRAFHPVRDYFNTLPEWDGIERVDTLLVDVLGAEDTPYTRAVTRKTLVAAIRRTFHPGTKFDQVLTLVGPQGIGKSTIFAKLAGQWFSDSLTITDMKDKTGAEKLAGNLIVELPELAGIRKMDAESVKAFISRTEDKYRPAYGRTVQTYPRECIITGSTNMEDGFLKDPTGNRRWWAVNVTGYDTVKAAELTDQIIDQIWAEALYYERQGEELFLRGELLEAAIHVQASSVEADDRTGLVAEYLNTPLPQNWDMFTLNQRRIYLDGGSLPAHENTGGTWHKFEERTTVSKIEIWSECFGRDPDAMRRSDSYDIASIMQQIDGWEDNGARTKQPIYGRQRVYERSHVLNHETGTSDRDKPGT